MNRNTKSNVRMYDAVRTTLEKHQSAWSENPALVAGVEQFHALFEELKTVSQKHESCIAGVKTLRDHFLDELIHNAMILRGGLVVFAHETKKFDVLEKLNFTTAKLRYASQLELRHHMANIYDLVMEHETSLAGYGISSEKIIAFMDLYEEFEEQIVAVRKGTIERKFLTSRIKELIAKIKSLFDQKLDILVRLLAIEQPEFFKAYKDARILIEQKHRSVKQEPPESESDIGIAS